MSLAPACPWCWEGRGKATPADDGHWECPCGKTFRYDADDQREAAEIAPEAKQ